MDTNEITRLVNRHMARLLTKLTDANCPEIFVDAVKSHMAWLRSDLQGQTNTKESHEENQTHG